MLCNKKSNYLLSSINTVISLFLSCTTVLCEPCVPVLSTSIPARRWSPFTIFFFLLRLNSFQINFSSLCSSWLQIQRSRVQFPALPDFLSSSGSGTGSTQPREVNWGATWIKKVAAPVQKTEINSRGDPLRWPRDTPLSAKDGTNFADRRRPLCRYSSLAD